MTSRAFHEAMLMPPNRHKRAIIPDSLFPNIKKKQLTQDMTLDPAGGGGKEGEGEATFQSMVNHCEGINTARYVFLPSILKRPILSINSADTMLPGNTAKVPRKLTK